MATRKTIVGDIDREVLAFTVGKDPVLDAALVESDCIGTAAHVTMLSKIEVRPRLIGAGQRRDVIATLVGIMRKARRGKFAITEEDQDVHLAVERALTRRLGNAGKKVHFARSRNDQIAVDMRLYAKEHVLGCFDEIAALAGALLKFARKHASLPMVGRTHMQPAMPSSVGLWASSYVESLLEDADLLSAAYELNDRCPLGAAAGYGIPVPVDRNLTARLLGFAGPLHNVLHAAGSRGKCELAILSAMSQVMLTLSRLATDMILYSMPEFGYFTLPAEYCTGSSIMPQKNNPDVLELVRARTARVAAHAAAVAGVLNGLPGGYNRDLQETKEPFMAGMATTRGCVRIMGLVVSGLVANKEALAAGFSPEVFATDEVVRLVADGISFRDAYNRVKSGLDTLSGADPAEVIGRKTHVGGTAGLDFKGYSGRISAIRKLAAAGRRKYHGAVSRLLGVKYPELKK